MAVTIKYEETLRILRRALTADLYYHFLNYFLGIGSWYSYTYKV